MIKVSVFYSNEEGKNFDMNYYCNKHMPMVIQLLGDSCINAEVDQGFAGVTPGSKATYIAMGHFSFKTVDDFIAAFMPHANKIMGDIPNFTDISPIFQISEVKL